MDDVSLILNALKKGWRLYFSEGWKKEDDASEESATLRTSRIIKGIMNSILKFLNLVMYIGDDFKDEVILKHLDNLSVIISGYNTQGDVQWD